MTGSDINVNRISSIIWSHLLVCRIAAFPSCFQSALVNTLECQAWSRSHTPRGHQKRCNQQTLFCFVLFFLNRKLASETPNCTQTEVTSKKKKKTGLGNLIRHGSELPGGDGGQSLAFSLSRRGAALKPQRRWDGEMARWRSVTDETNEGSGAFPFTWWISLCSFIIILILLWNYLT